MGLKVRSFKRHYACALAIVVVGIFGGLLGSFCSPGPDFGHHHEEPDNGYLAGVKTSLEKVFREPERLKGELSQRAIVGAARNEYEHFQIILVSHGGDLENIEIESTQLTCLDQGEVIQKENIAFYQVGYVETKRPAYDVEFVGWWPDPLIPLEQFDLAEGKVQPIWVTIYIPESTPSGDYQGCIKIIPENAEAETVEVVLTVWDFTLPEESSLQAVFSLYEEVIRDFYRFDVLPPEILRRYYSFLLAHRINPTSLYLRGDPQPRLENLEFCVDRGLNALNIAYLYDWGHSGGTKAHLSDEYERNLTASLSHTVAFLREHGWLEKAFIYGPDEPGQRDYSAVREMLSLVGRMAPGVRRVVTVGPVEDLYGYVDVWVPRIGDYDAEKCRRRQAIGEEVWLYVCASPLHPYPNFFVDYPAIDHRILFWMAWKYDISGFLYYSLNRWMTNQSNGQERWPDIPWNTFTWRDYNGDGQLIYPGRGGEPYSSIRLEIIRDGIEDFEYLHMLQARMRELAEGELESQSPLLYSAEDLLAAMKEKAVSDFTHYTKDENQLLEYRELVAEEIVRLSRILEGGTGF